MTIGDRLVALACAAFCAGAVMAVFYPQLSTIPLSCAVLLSTLSILPLERS